MSDEHSSESEFIEMSTQDIDTESYIDKVKEQVMSDLNNMEEFLELESEYLREMDQAVFSK